MIEILNLTDFRNHLSSRIKTSGRRNVIITGPNGSGKTAALEALSMLSGAVSLRGAPITEIARKDGTNGFAVNAKLADGTELSVSMALGDTNRRARIDGDAAPLSDLVRYLRMVWLTPREDRLFVDTASDRRAFFDRLVAGFDAAHAGRCARLAKLLSERAFALKRGADDNWIRPIEHHLAQTAVSIAAARVRYAGEINYELERGGGDAATIGASYFLTISGMLESRLAAGTDAAAVEVEYIEYLADNRELVADKMVVDGAHKSDFGMFNKTLDSAVHITSTGQQKMALFALILGHARLVHQKTGANPIILLDEAAAHLDATARAALFAELARADASVWATGIDVAIFKDVPNAVFITCENGTVECKV